AALDDLFGIEGRCVVAKQVAPKLVVGLAAAAQSAFQLLARWRQDEDAHRIRHLLLHLGRALHVDIEQQVVSASRGLAREAPRRSVVVTEHLSVFKELILADHALELFAADKEILAA